MKQQKNKKAPLLWRLLSKLFGVVGKNSAPVKTTKVVVPRLSGVNNPGLNSGTDSSECKKSDGGSVFDVCPLEPHRFEVTHKNNSH